MDGGDEMVLFLNMYVSGRLMVFLCSGFFFHRCFCDFYSNNYQTIFMCKFWCVRPGVRLDDTLYQLELSFHGISCVGRSCNLCFSLRLLPQSFTDCSNWIFCSYTVCLITYMVRLLDAGEEYQ